MRLQTLHLVKKIWLLILFCLLLSGPNITQADVAAPQVEIKLGEDILPWLLQCKSTWSRYPYKGKGMKIVKCDAKPQKPGRGPNPFPDDICESGCGIVSLAKVMIYYGVNVSPKDTADFAASVGAHEDCGGGTKVNKVCKKLSTKWPQLKCTEFVPPKKNSGALVEAIRNKKPIIFACHKCVGKDPKGNKRTYSSHYMVISGINAAGTMFYINDSGAINNPMVTMPVSELTKSTDSKDHVMTAYVVEKN